ncbi:MAG: glutathione S-transferase family protein [Parvibaculum sp.]
MAAITLHGPAYSVYTRIVRVTLAEKGLGYTLAEVDFISGGMPDEQKARHPFGVVPALVHGRETFIETAAITTYLDECFPDPAMRSATPEARARMNAAISVLDQYLWPDIQELVTQSLFTALVGGWPDDSIKERMVKRLSETLPVLERDFLQAGHFGGDVFTLADAHAAPMIAYLSMTVEGAGLLAQCPALASWWGRVKQRASLVATEIDFQAYAWARRGDD